MGSNPTRSTNNYHPHPLLRRNAEVKFRSNYEQSLANVLATFHIPKTKSVYKAYNITAQNTQAAPEVISSLLTQLEPTIERIDIYCAYYNQPFVSVFGEAAGQRILPIVFIEKNENAFPHVCAWKCLMTYPQETDLVFQLDHFDSKLTPAWRVLKSSNIKLQVFFSGCECNPLIATADVVLRLIELFQYGNVNGRSLLAPIVGHAPVLKEKLRFHNLGGKGEDQHHTAPVVNVDIDLADCIKKPTYYIVWKPEKTKANLKSIFETGAFYNGIMTEAVKTNGCVKYLDNTDVMHWDVTQDFLCPFGMGEEDYLNSIKELGHSLPRVFRPKVS